MVTNIVSYLSKGLILLLSQTTYLQDSLSYDQIISHIPRSIGIYIVYISVLVMFLYTFFNYLRLGKFSFFRAFASPTIYILILALTINYSNVEGDVYAALAGIPGIFGGILIGRDALFVRRHNQVLYRRSFFATIVWTLALYIRLSVLFFYPIYAYIVFSSAFLSFLTGLIFGEAIRIYLGHGSWNTGI